MKYKIGDKVKIKSKEWYEENKDEHGKCKADNLSFTRSMANYCGKNAIINENNGLHYKIDIDSGMWSWDDYMFEEEISTTPIPASTDPHLLLAQISTLTHTLDVLCATGHSELSSIVTVEIMKLIKNI